MKPPTGALESRERIGRRPQSIKSPKAIAVPGESIRAPLTAALIDAATHALSFATPGHRCGKSCRSVLDR